MKLITFTTLLAFMAVTPPVSALPASEETSLNPSVNNTLLARSHKPVRDHRKLLPAHLLPPVPVLH